MTRSKLINFIYEANLDEVLRFLGKLSIKQDQKAIDARLMTVYKRPENKDW